MIKKTYQSKPAGKPPVASVSAKPPASGGTEEVRSKDPDAPWYAVYTRSRWEKRLMELLREKGIEAYVPLRKVIHQWSDRKKLVEEPLIRSYCFVKVGELDYYEVLNTPGAVRYIWFSGKPAAIPERQINTLKVITGSDVEVECIEDTFQPGIRVMVNGGPLTGITGELVSITNKKKVVVRIDHLKQVLTLSISPLLLERVHS
ncbi:MAG: UpxY family transcription antiterminator [Bacteroidota bacterium]